MWQQCACAGCGQGVVLALGSLASEGAGSEAGTLFSELGSLKVIVWRGTSVLWWHQGCLPGERNISVETQRL